MGKFPLCEAAGLRNKALHAAVFKDDVLVVALQDVEALFAEAPVAYGYEYTDEGGKNSVAFGMSYDKDVDTHTARLVCIQPIVRDTAESLLREALNVFQQNWGNASGPTDLSGRIRALLERQGGSK